MKIAFSTVCVGLLLSVASCNSNKNNEGGSMDSTSMDNTQSQMEGDTMATDSMATDTASKSL